MKIRVEYDDGLPFAEHEIVQKHAAAWRALFGDVPAAHTEYSGTAADLAARRFADDLVKATRAAERNLEGRRPGTAAALPTDPVAPPPAPRIPPPDPSAQTPVPGSPPAAGTVPPPPPVIPPAVPVAAPGEGQRTQALSGHRLPWVLGIAGVVLLVMAIVAESEALGALSLAALVVSAIWLFVRWGAWLRETFHLLREIRKQRRNSR